MKENMIKTSSNSLGPFTNLSERDKELLENHSKLLAVSMGKYLFNKGGNGEFDHYLTEGKVEIQTTNKKSMLSIVVRT